MATQTGPRLRIEGSCEGCCHLRTGNVVLACSHPQIRKEPTGVAIVSMKAKHEAWDMRGNMRHDCPELPAARLALARSVVAEGPCEWCGGVARVCGDPSCDGHRAAVTEEQPK